MSTILVVEDDLNTRLGLYEMLTEEGYHVESAADGASAVRKIESESVDVLLSDLRLPDTTGLQLHEKVQKLSPKTSTIIMTAYGSPESQGRAAELGVFCWLTKPLNIDSLLATIKKAV